MRRSLSRCPAAFLLLLCALASPLPAQAPDTAAALDPNSAAPGPTLPFAPLVTLGSAAEDRLRLQQILGETPTNGFLIRSASTLTPPLHADSESVRWRVIPPELNTVWNSALPFSLNDGALWAGRGLNTQIMAGVRARAGRLSLIFAPQVVHYENLEIRDFVASSADERSAFSSPFHEPPRSADLPIRFGNRSLTIFDFGQSTLALRAGPVVTGISSENQWWGPGIRNGIVMSNHAAGIPHIFVRTGEPVRTKIGEIEAKWVLGGLTESLYFDDQSSNDIRSFNAVSATWRPAWDPNLAIGFARAVYVGVGGASDIPGHAFDVLAEWGQPEGPVRNGAADALASLFGRWVFPGSGFELYGEWARIELPRSFRDLLTAPDDTQGYTVGLQWANRVNRAEHLVRLQSEITYLEQNPRPDNRSERSFYTSPSVRQGYTQRGQVIGASIGPGGSSQWIAADYLAPRWQVGLFGGRIRWENDAYYRQPTGVAYFAHDVTVWGGVRAAVRFRWADLSAELATGQRYNYLFQNEFSGYGPNGRFDVRNRTFRLAITPASLPR